MICDRDAEDLLREFEGAIDRFTAAVFEPGHGAEEVKARCLDLVLQWPGARKQAQPMLRGKLLPMLEQVRSAAVAVGRPPTQEDLEWWVSVSDLATEAWWAAYYREQAIEAQSNTAAGWAALGAARYAIAVLRELERIKSATHPPTAPAHGHPTAS